MATNRNSEHLRYRYGICLNDNCEKCKSKEVQQIPARKDFVCQNPECGKPLRECPPPKTPKNKLLIAIVSAVVIIGAGIGAYFTMFQKPSEPELVGVDTVTVDQTIYQISTYKLGDITTRDSVVIGQVEKSRELLSTDTITVGKTVMQIKTYQNGNAIEQDTLVIGQGIRELVKTDTITEGKSILQVRTFKTGDVVEYDTLKIGDVPDKKKPVSSAPMPKVSFGTYTGPQSGLDGEIRVTRSYSLDLRNSSHETIELQPGDVITHTKFKNGELVSGYWKRGSQGRSFHR